MIYILGYLRKHVLQYNTLPYKSLILIKAVAYLFDKNTLSNH